MSPMRWLILALIIVVALPAGWLLGMLEKGDASKAPQPQVATAVAPEAVPGTQQGPEQPTPPAGIDVSVGQSEPARPAPTASSAPPPPVRIIRPSAVVSSWTDLESAVAESERSGKPVMIDFSADWCGPCQRLKRQVFDDSNHGQAVQTAVIPVSIVDRRREQGSNPSSVEELYQRFQVDAFPTLVVFNPKTGRAVRTQGFGGAQATVAWINEAAEAVR